MTTLVGTLSTVELSTVTHHRTSSHNYNVNLEENKQLIEQLSEPYKLVDSIQNNEQLGDEKREDENNELEAQKYYDRAFRFCTLARTL
ncbi:unnamed protein product [Adineta steineri]|uniref:Uncharacterized protein n=1 Tax=Adineta steineri TaxID=433720 RepID=A0A815YQ47_9BILA|nr:unnamed protein product [Adineta steineri]CAF1574064.1 unnamed protein product [Adineta steineri]